MNNEREISIIWTDAEKMSFIKNYVEVKDKKISEKDKFEYAQKDIREDRKKKQRYFSMISWFKDYLEAYLIYPEKEIPTPILKTPSIPKMNTEKMNLHNISEFLLKESKNLEERVSNIEKKELEIKEKLFAITQKENEIKTKETLLKEQELRISKEKQEYIKAIQDTLKESIFNEETLTEILSTIIKKEFEKNTSKQIQQELKAPCERIGLKKILIFNLGSAALNNLKNEFENIYDISIWKDRTNISNILKSNLDFYYKIYGATDFMPHNIDTYLKENVGDKYVRFTGSVSTLKSLLEELYMSEQNA